MGFISAVLMTNTTAQNAFLMMIALMTNFDLISFFKPGFPGLNESFYIHNRLMQKYLPKLHEHFS